MIAKHGSEEEVRTFMQQSGLKAARPGTGGFAHMKKNDPDRLKQLSSDAAKKRYKNVPD